MAEGTNLRATYTTADLFLAAALVLHGIEPEGSYYEQHRLLVIFKEAAAREIIRKFQEHLLPVDAQHYAKTVREYYRHLRRGETI